MILQPSNVELTKIHYYDKTGKNRNLRVATISREVYENSFNRNVIIKKNIFGQRWVLRINEKDDDLKKKSRWRIVLYVLVFCSIVLATGFGIFFSLDKLIFKDADTTPNKYHLPGLVDDQFTIKNTRKDRLLNATLDEKTKANETKPSTQPPPFCTDCVFGMEICMKIEETEKPRCVLVSDHSDPTGCGGLCGINTQFCQILVDAEVKVFQCSPLAEILECPRGEFSCGNMCIAENKKCDGTMDCSDRSDENNCDCDLTAHFQCGNFTSCLDITRKCDRRIDCWDKSDEMGCNKAVKCPNNEHPCHNNQCLPAENFCDGTPDCTDASDEPEGCRG